MNKTYISLDIECTGFDTSLDQLIEIAAIKFEGDTILEEFETLINPKIKIPSIITHITGIKDEDVANSPAFEEIQEKLAKFLGNFPIIGHNIDFDVNFLKAKGMKLTNPLFDTLQLSTILLPKLPSYSLDTIGRLLKIEHENKHRAMSDTKACLKLFRILEEKIQQINPVITEEIIEVLDKSTLGLRDFFINNLPTKLKEKKRKDTKPELKEIQLGTTLTEEDILGSFDSKSKLSKIVEGYELRPAQKQMTEAILDGFKNDKKKIIEAGTGIGKTLSYLMASLYWSIKHHTKIVISTHTHHLQDQILNKDIPLLQKLFEPAELKIALLKGRHNYLSQRRLELFLTKENFFDHEAIGLIKILIWLTTTESGELDEITFLGKEIALVEAICCAEHVCSHENAAFKDGCYLLKARQKALSANIIIVNHALLLQDTFSTTPILPEYQYLIIDEAHQLEPVTTDALTVRLSFFPFLKPFDQFKRTLNHFIQKPSSFFDTKVNPESLTAIREKTEQIILKIEMFFGFVGIFYEKNLKPYDGQWEINLQESDYLSKEWQQVKMTGESIVEVGLEILSAFKKIMGAMEDSDDEIWKELRGHNFECEEKIAELQNMLKSEQKSADEITWIFKSSEENVGIKRSPLVVSEQLKDNLFSKKQSIVLTSATLRTENSFDFIREQLGLGKEFEELALASHFSYPDQVKILIPEDLPEPASEGYFLSCAKLISNIIQKNQGRTLVLFTSKKALAATYHKVAPELKQVGITLLGQNITGGRGKILEHFKDEPQSSAIFGTNSFWEGVDLQGNQLNCVIIQKLPFDPPMDPIVAARSKKYKDGFKEYQIPRAILRFKQGFGRLIRSSKDTGSIVVLDSRIIQKDYGRKFLESLPAGIKIEYGSQNNLQDLL